MSPPASSLFNRHAKLTSDYYLGEGVQLIKCELVKYYSINSHTTLNRCYSAGFLSVGHFSYVARATLMPFVTIASRVSVGASDHPFHFAVQHDFSYGKLPAEWGFNQVVPDARESQASTSIGADVWIGDNAVVLQGVSIGVGAVIGAGAVVTKDVAPYSIVVGNPARQIKLRFPENTVEKLVQARWWELPPRMLANLDLRSVDSLLACANHHIKG
jgi:acetyltransferase-like isoleucine patch superfamily enzyme